MVVMFVMLMKVELNVHRGHYISSFQFLILSTYFNCFLASSSIVIEISVSLSKVKFLRDSYTIPDCDHINKLSFYSLHSTD